MGIEDRSSQHLGGKSASPIKTGLIPMMIFWCVVMGLRMGDDNEALLGQSFLSKFDITMEKTQMVLRAR